MTDPTDNPHDDALDLWLTHFESRLIDHIRSSNALQRELRADFEAGTDPGFSAAYLLELYFEHKECLQQRSRGAALANVHKGFEQLQLRALWEDH